MRIASLLSAKKAACKLNTHARGMGLRTNNNYAIHSDCLPGVDATSIYLDDFAVVAELNNRFELTFAATLRIPQGLTHAKSRGEAHKMTGAELRQARLEAGLTQQQLANKTGFHRLAVGYWENKSGTFTARHGAAYAFAMALGMKYYSLPIRARAAWGFTEPDTKRIEAELARMAKAHAQRQATMRMRCNAKTRKGTPCRALSLPGKQRCKFHGGLSTGPRTIEGREKIAEAQLTRWRNFREKSLYVSI